MSAVRAKEALGCHSDCQTLNALNAMYGQHAALGPQQCGRLLQEWMGNQLTETSSTSPQPAAAPDISPKMRTRHTKQNFFHCRGCCTRAIDLQSDDPVACLPHFISGSPEKNKFPVPPPPSHRHRHRHRHSGAGSLCGLQLFSSSCERRCQGSFQANAHQAKLGPQNGPAHRRRACSQTPLPSAIC
jgi:hypothetical protein